MADEQPTGEEPKDLVEDSNAAAIDALDDDFGAPSELLDLRPFGDTAVDG